MHRLSTFNLSRYAVIINFLSAIGFFLTFLFQIVIAKEFGASRFTDAYIGATTFPLIFISIISGLIQKSFIPLFFSYNKKDLWKKISNFISINAYFFVTVIILGYIFSRQIITIILPGFYGDMYDMALKLSRIFLPALFFGSLSGILRALYYAERSFVIPSITPSLKWIIAIFFTLFFKDRYGIIAVPAGLVLGYILEFFILWSMAPGKIHLLLHFNIKEDFFLTTLILIWPLLIAQLFNNINIVFLRRISSQLGEGSITYIEYAYNIITTLVVLCIQGLSVVVFPVFSSYISRNSFEKLRALFLKTQRVILIVLVPIIAGLIVLRLPVIKLFLERGKFTSEDTLKIANLIPCFSGAFLALGLGTIQSQIYYALKNTRRVMFIGFIQTLTFLISLYITREKLSIYILALDFSVAIITGCMINYFHLNYILKIKNKYSEILFLFKLIIAALVMSLVSITLFTIVKNSNIALFFPLIFSVFSGALVYIWMILKVFKIRESSLVLTTIFPKKFIVQ